MKKCNFLRVFAFFAVFFYFLFFCSSCDKAKKTDLEGMIPFVLLNGKNESSFMKGFDASMVYEIEANGGVYFDKNGNAVDIFSILKSNGINWIRLRLWHSPDMMDKNLAGHNELSRTVEIAERIKMAGLNFLLDIHFSDSWADPGNQKYPAAWDSVTSLYQLQTLVSDYTTQILTELKDYSPDMIQLGNEINPGFLVTLSNATSIEEFAPISCSSYKNEETIDNFSKVFSSASAVARTICPNAKIMIHLASSKGDSLKWWFEKFEALDFDVIGLSYYPFEDHGTQAQLEQNIAELKFNYQKEVVIAETSWAWTNVWKDEKANVFYTEQEASGAERLTTLKAAGITASATKAGQKQVLSSIINSCKKAGGSGVFYWGGDWIPCDNVPDTWENQALFDFDGKALPALEVFLEN